MVQACLDKLTCPLPSVPVSGLYVEETVPVKQMLCLRDFLLKAESGPSRITRPVEHCPQVACQHLGGHIH